MKVVIKNNEIVISDCGVFNLEHTFECGQCFRWKRQPDGSYEGVVGDELVSICYDGAIHIKGSEDSAFWIEYLDLNRDYEKLCSVFKDLDDNMAKAVAFAEGLRILKQDFFETLISFIISQNNNVPRISGIIGRLCCEYGNEIAEGVYRFPKPEALAAIETEEFVRLGAGYRSKYLSETSRIIASGSFDVEKLRQVGLEEAQTMLQTLPGIGPKVADCVLLYSGTNYGAFPTDVWVKRVMEALYFEKSVKNTDIMRFAAEYFGNVAGFAQQYLFHYARMNKIQAV